MVRFESEESARRSSERSEQGAWWAGSEDGAWTMVVYFTSEDAAREGERKDPPPESAELLQELDSLAVGETTFLDLRDPWPMSPA